MYESSEINLWFSFQESIKVSLWTIPWTLEDHMKANLNNRINEWTLRILLNLVNS